MLIINHIVITIGAILLSYIFLFFVSWLDERNFPRKGTEKEQATWHIKLGVTQFSLIGIYGWFCYTVFGWFPGWLFFLAHVLHYAGANQDLLYWFWMIMYDRATLKWVIKDKFSNKEYTKYWNIPFLIFFFGTGPKKWDTYLRLVMWFAALILEIHLLTHY